MVTYKRKSTWKYHLVSKKVWQRIRFANSKKSLYGLKQSPRAWFDRFTKVVLKLGYKQGQADHTLFVKKSHAGKMTILIVYVDDIILSGNDMEELQNLKKYLLEEFEVKDLGNLKYFLGMEVARSRKGIVVSQENTYSIFLRRPVCLDANQLILLWIVRRNLVSRKKVHR